MSQPVSVRFRRDDVASRVKREAAAQRRSTCSPGEAPALRLATSNHRPLVTKNAKDFDRIVRMWATAGEHHAGVIFTSPRRFHRGSTSYPDNLVKALGDLLSHAPAEMTDRIHWL